MEDPFSWSADVEIYYSSKGLWVEVEVKCIIQEVANQANPNIR